MATKDSNFFSDAQIEEAARLFAVLADASRLRLLKALMASEHSVTELIEITGLTQANVSRHLSVLHSARFLDRHKEGSFVIYALRDPVVRDLCQLMCGRLKTEASRLARLLGGK